MKMQYLVQTFGERFNTHFKSLVGLQVECLKEVTVDYYVKGIVKLSDESEFPVHYRWSSEEEERVCHRKNDHICGTWLCRSRR